MHILEVDSLVKNYGRNSKGQNIVKVLKGLSFTIDKGEFVGVMGRSGCGKTTLLKVLGMIDTQTDGMIRFMEIATDKLFGDKLADIRREKIGFVFQDYYLMESMTVEENIMLPMVLGREKLDLIRKEVDNYTEKFQISHLLKKSPHELSGGEKQRVGICRALIYDPDLILADEPTGNLDSNSSQVVIDSLADINQEMGKTVVLVTHDPIIASYCQRILFLKDGGLLEDLKRTGTQEIFYEEILKRMKYM